MGKCWLVTVVFRYRWNVCCADVPKCSFFSWQILSNLRCTRTVKCKRCRETFSVQHIFCKRSTVVKAVLHISFLLHAFFVCTIFFCKRHLPVAKCLARIVTGKSQHAEQALYKAAPFPWPELGLDHVYFKPESLLSYNFHFLFVYFWCEHKPA